MAEIRDSHKRSGAQCLRIHGGEDRTVMLHLEDAAGAGAQLSFWAERWTARNPFEFKVEARRGRKWVLVYDGAKTIRIGGFLTEVRVPLGETKQLRFRATSPDSSGVMIDDLRIEESAPMVVDGVTSRLRAVPALVRNRYNPIVQVTVNTSGDLEPRKIKRIEFETTGSTGLGGVKRFELYSTGGAEALNHRDSGAIFHGGQRIGKESAASEKLVFRDVQSLYRGANHFWLSVELEADADPTQTLSAMCTKVVLGNGTQLVPVAQEGAQVVRIGVALRNAGDDDSETYRIPGLVTTPKGTLIAVYDARWEGWVDLPGHIDVGMSRSTDAGRTWEPMKIILDMGDDPEWNGEGVGDPTILVDRVTGTIWVAAIWSHGKRAWRDSGPGMTPEETGQFILVRSDDDGATWSPPINITEQVKQPEWRYLLQGPGRGITMRNGTLVFPAQFKDAADLPHSTIIYSKDRGESWHIGGPARPNTTESQVVELADGVLMLNMRDNRGGSRAVCTTSDMGATWTEHPSSRKLLPEPTCNAALIRLDELNQKGSEHWLAFCNPSVNAAPRREMTVQLSPDGGSTWPANMRLMIDEGLSAGYPSMAMIDDETLGILFEGSLSQITFLALPLDALR
jgi:sialidase-1